MRFPALRQAASVLAVLALPSGALAQFGARARADRAGAPADTTASVTVVDPRESTRVAATLDEALVEAPGLRLPRLGALGSPVTLSLRGSSGEQVVVLFGDLPLAPADGSAFDLGTLPLALVERAEVARGGAPASFGASGIGGVVRLVPRAGRSGGEAELSLGAFGLGGVRAAAVSGDAARGVHLTAVAGALRSAGDFPYVDDRDTTLDPTDDRDVSRQNGETLDGYALLHARAHTSAGSIEGLAALFERTGGIPGPAAEPTTAAHQSHARLVLGGAWRSDERAGDGELVDRGDPAVRGFASLGLIGERRRVDDIYNEIGLAQRAADDRTLRIFARGGVSIRAADVVTLHLQASEQVDSFDPSNAFARVPNASSLRSITSTQLEAHIETGIDDARFELRASSRVDFSWASLGEIRAGATEGRSSETSVVAPGGRLAMRFDVNPHVAIGASGFTAIRMPGITELFGDRAFLVGDTALRPERAFGGDVSLIVGARFASRSRLALEARAFITKTDDLITWARSSQYTATARNLGSGTAAGGELGVRADLERVVRTVVALTLLDASGSSGRALPLRPRATLYARIEAIARPGDRVDELGAFVDLTYVGANFADLENLVVVRERTQFGVGIRAKLFHERLDIGARMNDLFDARAVDVLGFPLPGRAWYVTVAGRWD